MEIKCKNKKSVRRLLRRKSLEGFDGDKGNTARDEPMLTYRREKTEGH
jgi:hypothetical protein